MTKRDILALLKLRYPSHISVGAAAPSSPKANDLWVDTTGPTLKYYNGSTWVSVSV